MFYHVASNGSGFALVQCQSPDPCSRFLGKKPSVWIETSRSWCAENTWCLLFCSILQTSDGTFPYLLLLIFRDRCAAWGLTQPMRLAIVFNSGLPRPRLPNIVGYKVQSRISFTGRLLQITYLEKDAMWRRLERTNKGQDEEMARFYWFATLKVYENIDNIYTKARSTMSTRVHARKCLFHSWLGSM